MNLFSDIVFFQLSFELLGSYSPTNTAEAYSSCWIKITDEYRGRLFELLDSYSTTNTADAYSSC